MPYKDMQKKELNKLRRRSDPTLSQRDKLYNIWRGMRKRCYCPTYYAYPQYGGRGIGICEEWRSFESFYKWALENGYSPSLSIDRIDNNGNYEPCNCRWATWKEQGNNRRTTVLVTYNGKTQSVTMWAEEIGIPRETLRGRLNRGKMSIEEALTAQKNQITRWNRKGA